MIIIKRIVSTTIDMIIPFAFTVWKGDYFLELNGDVYLFWLWGLYLFFVLVFLLSGSRGTFGDILCRVKYNILKPGLNLKKGMVIRNLILLGAIILFTIGQSTLHFILTGIALLIFYWIPIAPKKEARQLGIDSISGVKLS